MPDLRQDCYSRRLLVDGQLLEAWLKARRRRSIFRWSDAPLVLFRAPERISPEPVDLFSGSSLEFPGWRAVFDVCPMLDEEPADFAQALKLDPASIVEASPAEVLEWRAERVRAGRAATLWLDPRVWRTCV